MPNCLNCENPFEGNYFPNCGQSAITKRVDVHFLLHDVLHFFHLDGSFFYTSWQLLVRPGATINDYLQGKRKKYFGPTSILLTVAGIFFLLYKWGDIDPLNVMAQMIYALDDSFYQGKMQVPDWVLGNYALLELFIFVPMFSLGSYLSFFKVVYTFYEHLGINAFLSAQRMLVGIFTFPILFFFKKSGLSLGLELIMSTLELGFTVWAYMDLFRYYQPGARFARVWLTFLVVFFTLSLFILMLSQV